MAEGILLPQFIAPEPDLSGYSLITHTHTPASIGAAASSHSHSGYASSSHSHSGYATQTWVTQNFAPKGGSGTTDPTPGTGLGGVGTSTASMAASSIEFPWTPTIGNNYGSANLRYGAKIGTMLKLSVPSAISAMTISWTAGNWTIAVQKLLGESTDASKRDAFTGKICLTSLTDASYGSPAVDGSEYSEGLVFENKYRKLILVDSIWPPDPTPNTYSYTKNYNTAAGSYTYPASSIASIAGSTMYIVMVCTMASWYGLNHTRTGIFTLNNTINFTVRIS